MNNTFSIRLLTSKNIELDPWKIYKCNIDSSIISYSFYSLFKTFSPSSQCPFCKSIFSFIQKQKEKEIETHRKKQKVCHRNQYRNIDVKKVDIVCLTVSVQRNALIHIYKI